MEDLYPGGTGYHRAHEAYIKAIADALESTAFAVADWYADPNDPRDGAIQLDLQWATRSDGEPIWPHDEVWVGWSEDRGWHVLTIDDPHGKDRRFVYELDVARVASPTSVALAVAEKADLRVELPADEHPDADFPEHAFEDDDVPFELALRRYSSNS